MRKYTFVRQLESTDCGVAALSMICLYYGKETTITKLREVCGTGIQGTSIEGYAPVQPNWDLTTNRSVYPMRNS